MKNLVKVLLSLCLAVGIILNIEHVHDEECGYDPVTETGCIYEIDPLLLPPDEDDPPL